MLRHLPRDYIDLSAPFEVAAAPLGERCAVRAKVLNKGSEARIRGGLSIWKVLVGDDTGVMNLSFFNTRYTVAGLKEGEEYLFYGRVDGTLLSKEIRSPMVFPKEDALSGTSLLFWPVQPHDCRPCTALEESAPESAMRPRPCGGTTLR